MASTIKVDKIEGSTGSTITVPTGQTLTVTDGIPVASGGTGLASFTQGDILYATGATTLVKLAKGTGRQGLQTNSGATAPEWTDSPQSLMTAAGDVLYASGANTLAKLAKGSDDDVLTLASGVPSWAASAGGGKINQVIFGSFSTRFESGGTLDTWQDPGLTASITPSATDSRIFVLMQLGTIGGGAPNSPSIGMRIYRSGSGVTDGEIGVGAASGYSGLSLRGNSFGEEFNTTSATYLGYPAGGVSWMDTTHNTTSALTYKLQMINTDADSYTLNGTHSTATSEGYPSTVSTMTLWEILA